MTGAHGPKGGSGVSTTCEHDGPRAFELSASSTGGGVSANCSKRWGRAYRCGSGEFAISATVSVMEQKAGGGFDPPHGERKRDG
jgi:hypothetical protein